MTIEQLIDRLREGAIHLAEKSNLDLWEAGYLQAYIDLRQELERGEPFGYYAQLEKEIDQ